MEVDRKPDLLQRGAAPLRALAGGNSATTLDTKRRPDIVTALRLLSAALAMAAVLKELRLPQEERTWHGALARVRAIRLANAHASREPRTRCGTLTAPSSSAGCSALGGASISEPSSPSYARYAVPTELEGTLPTARGVQSAAGVQNDEVVVGSNPAPR